MTRISPIIALAALLATSQQSLRAQEGAATPISRGNWAGLYLGVHAGGAIGGLTSFEVPNQSFFGPNVSERLRLRKEGILGGLLVGNNWQSGNLVYGIEADAQAGVVEGSGYLVDLVSGFRVNRTEVTDRLNSYASLRARLGLATGNVLLFVSGGPAIGQLTLSSARLAVPGWSADRTRPGFAVSTGIEYRMSERWSARIEATYADFGSRQAHSGHGIYKCAPSCLTERVLNPRGDFFSMRFGVNYFLAPDRAGSVPQFARTWSGYYAGMTGGLTASLSDKTTWRYLPSPGVNVAPVEWVNTGLNTASVGALIGRNWQHDSVVYGVEIDAQSLAGNVRRQFYHPSFFPPGQIGGDIAARIDWLTTARIRLGYILNEQSLLYVNGGFAAGRTNLAFAFKPDPLGPYIQQATNSAIKLGYVIGAGIEHAIDQSWSGRLDVSYFNLGRMKVTRAPDPPPVIPPGGACIGGFACFPDPRPLQARRIVDGMSIRAGIIYRFGSGT